MRAISLWQPWASLWLSPAKVHETRHYRTMVRGPVIVHAAKRPIDLIDSDLEDLVGEHYPEPCEIRGGRSLVDCLPLGALLGIVHITDCVPTIGIGGKTQHASLADLLAGDWSAGRYAWRRSYYRRFETPIPWKGKQGFFEVPDNIIPAMETAP